MSFNLTQYGIDVKEIHRNSSVPVLYEIGLRHEPGTAISDSRFSGNLFLASTTDSHLRSDPDDAG